MHPIAAARLEGRDLHIYCVSCPASEGRRLACKCDLFVQERLQLPRNVGFHALA